MGPGAIAPVAVHRDVHELRTDRLQFLVADTEALRHTGPVVVDKDIRASRQLVNDLLARCGFEVEGDALLAAVHAGGAERPDPHPAEGIAAHGLDLDHARTEIGKDGDPQRRGDDGGELEDGDTR